MEFLGNARLELTLYFKSPSLGKIMFIAVDASPDDISEVERWPEGIAELIKRWCAALNRRRGVKDFRPATREEVVAFVRQRISVHQVRAAAQASRMCAHLPLAGALSVIQVTLISMDFRNKHTGPFWTRSAF